MKRPTHAYRKSLSGIAIFCLATMAAAATAATSPYPHSQVITALTWDLTTVTSLRKASGSDLWPATWAADGNLYAAWGDGGGFDGNSNSVGRVSLGFARIAGIPTLGNASSYAGTNIWGDAPGYAQSPATFGGKIDDLISVGGVLYGHGGLWTAANCGCADPVHRSGDNPVVRTLTWSSDSGRSWRIAPWTSGEDWGSSLQYGQDYRGAWDPGHVYLYYEGDIQADPHHLYLRRVSTSRLTESPADAGHYEYWTGQDPDGSATWSTNRYAAAAIFNDSNIPRGVYAAGGAVYDAPLGRYLLTTFHGNSTGQIGLFDAPRPWGPWSTIAYYDDWGGFDETAGEGNGLGFPSKWISADGRTLWGVFSGVAGGFDSFNLAKATLTVSNAIPVISTPLTGAELTSGDTVTAKGSGPQLSWSVELLNDGGPPIAEGSGNAITFVVPSNLKSKQIVRITASNPVSSVYRDYAISPAILAALPAITLDFVSTGKVFKVSTAQVGISAYIDRAYTITALSGPLAGGSLIRGSNNDKGVAAAKYLQFGLDRPGTVHVCYASQIGRPPAWLNDRSWAVSSAVCALNDGAGQRVVYEKTVPAGLVMLGGNREPPANGSGGYSNYIVIVGR